MNEMNDRADRQDDGDTWAVVLAAGEGTRLASVTRFLYGRDVPKQFAALDGDRTLLQQTMDRMAPVVPAHRTVVVVAEERRALAEGQLAPYRGVHIVSQPRNAGTGPGVLLPLAVIKARAPDARVIVTPSDHHISVAHALEQALARALAAARDVPAGLALLGAEADGAIPDLGWIVPAASDAPPTSGVGLVATFVEKPSATVAKQLFQRGGLWNTLIIAGSLDAFWRQAAEHMPAQTARLALYAGALAQTGGRSHAAADRLLARLYKSMPAADFSRAVLQNARGLGVVALTGSGWCDCGTPERLLTCLNNTVARCPHVIKAVLHSLEVEHRAMRPAEAIAK